MILVGMFMQAVQHLCGCHYGSCIQLKGTSQITQLNAVDTSLYGNIFIRYSLKSCGETQYIVRRIFLCMLDMDNIFYAHILRNKKAVLMMTVSWIQDQMFLR
mmetsp:Transcript_770/g.1035  ORF Transcript_770/g.1035 Transcript_770/m.1035 type:complete len:102 (-) Transcript_770:85-390(-)